MTLFIIYLIGFAGLNCWLSMLAIIDLIEGKINWPTYFRLILSIIIISAVWPSLLILGVFAKIAES